jgi:hypothetical protein
VTIWNYGGKNYFVIFAIKQNVIIKSHFAKNNWTFDNWLVKIGFENWLVLNLWEPTFKDSISFFQNVDSQFL